ncbi:MAG: FtsX-like permease family protein [Cytophagia bacterium]|nr:MAG: FtsX-like permease family protein [Cytophagia bacterium]TAG42858.1 MAG: FtsX-like permease family protein [Cytophagia bacterium]TAH29603.1 MAG: FtsX-like permease family protein [Cytophagales bacterium]
MNYFSLFNYSLISMQRKWRKQLSLCLIYSFVVAFYASVVFFTSSLRYETQFVIKDLPQLWIQKLAGGRLIPMENFWLDSLQKIRGVKEVYPRIWGYYFDSSTGAVFTVMGTEKPVNTLNMLSFSTIYKNKKNILQKNQAIVGTGFLAMRGLQIGENLSIPDAEGNMLNLEIIASFDSKSDLLTRDLIIVSPEYARKIIGLQQNQNTDFALNVFNPTEIDNIARRLDQKYASIRVVTKSQLEATYATLFGWRGGIWIYGSILALFAFILLVWERTSGLSEQEKKELGILKALGWQINEVVLIRLYEGLIISLTATFLGILLAFFHVFWLEAPLFKPFLVGWSVLYPRFSLFPIVELNSILIIFSLSIFPYLLATIIPAWKGAIIEPSEAMK